MEITVLGSGAAYPRAGGACSGYLFTSDGTKVWVDAGNGTLSNLQRDTDLRDVDALILTHAHADHIADVLPLMYALGFDPERPLGTSLPLYAPPDVAPAIVAPLGARSQEMFQDVFDVRSIVDPFEVGPLGFEPFPTVHPVETYGLRVAGGDKLAVYTSDTAAFAGLGEACRGADLLIGEATYIDGVEAAPDIHMWARQTGRVAAKAGAGRLVLTHVWPTFDLQRSATEASEEFDGPVEPAIEGDRYKL